MQQVMRSLLPIRSTIRRDQPKEQGLVDIEQDDASQVFAALNSDTAREILSALYDQPRTASDIAEVVDTSLQNTRYHLDKLLNAGLVEVVDTWYSGQGREMKVYDTTHNSLIVYAADRATKESIRGALTRLLGAVGLLALFAIAIDYGFRVAATADYRGQDVAADVTREAVGTGYPAVYGSPGLLVFIGGSFVIVLLAVRWYMAP